MKLEQTIEERLVRLETKLTRGFEELGIALESNTTWLTVDEASRIVNLKTDGRSLKVILREMHKRGASSFGEIYQMKMNGRFIGSIVLR